MAQLDDIRQALAANLRAVMAVDEGQVSAYLLDNPTAPSLQVAGVDSGGFTYISFGDPPSIRWVILVEAWLGKVSGVGAQKLLNRLVTEVGEAVESDTGSDGALFSRLQDDGTLLTGQPAAADSVAFLEYRGQTPLDRGGSTYLTANWAVEVIA